MPSLGSDGTLLFARTEFLDDRNLAWVAADGSVEWVLDEAKPYGFPALSPDQRKVAFQVNEAPGSEVWVHDLDRNTTTKLTRRVGINGSPLWMPGGERILLTSDLRGEGWDLYLTAVDGSGEPILVYDASSYVWPTSVSSDGQFVLLEQMTRANREDVFRLNLEDGSLDVVVSSPATEASGSFSPDDRWFAYHSDETGQLEVYVRPLATAAGRIQVSNGGGANPMWSRRGDRLFYRQRDQLMVVDIAVDGSEIVVGRQQLFVGGVTDASVAFASADVFDVSSDGSRVLMVLDDPNVTFTPRLGVIVGFLDELRQMAKDAAR